MADRLKFLFSGLLDGVPIIDATMYLFIGNCSHFIATLAYGCPFLWSPVDLLNGRGDQEPGSTRNIDA